MGCLVSAEVECIQCSLFKKVIKPPNYYTQKGQKTPQTDMTETKMCTDSITCCLVNVQHSKIPVSRLPS